MAGSVSNSTGGPVSDEGRGARFPVLMSWWTICSAIFYLYLAPTLAVAFGSANAIIGIVLTVITYSLLAPVFARRAIETGFSAEHLSERVFGKVGAAFAALILGLTALYYAIFEGSILAVAVTQVVGGLDFFKACIVVVALTLPFVLSDRILVYFERANFVLLPMYLTGLAALVIFAGHNFGWSGKWLTLGPEHPTALGWWDCYAAYMGVWVLIVITSDFARLGRKADAAFHARVTFGLPFYAMTFLVNGLIGIFLVGTVDVRSVSETAIVDASTLILGGTAGLAFIAATQLRINLANFYVSAFNVSSVIQAVVGKRPPHWAVVLVICAVSAFVMTTQGAFQYMLVSLQYMGIFLCSWVGVALVSPSSAAEPEQTVPHFRRGALAAWIAATVLAIAVSLGPRGTASFAPAVSFLVSVALTSVLRRRRDSGTRSSGLFAAQTHSGIDGGSPPISL
jgi:hypothetical protein